MQNKHQYIILVIDGGWQDVTATISDLVPCDSYAEFTAYVERQLLKLTQEYQDELDIIQDTIKKVDTILEVTQDITTREDLHRSLQRLHRYVVQHQLILDSIHVSRAPGIFCGSKRGIFTHPTMFSDTLVVEMKTITTWSIRVKPIDYILIDLYKNTNTGEETAV